MPAYQTSPRLTKHLLYICNLSITVNECCYDPTVNLITLPLSSIMKSDPDVGITSQDSIFLVAKATEQFVAYLAKELGQRTHEEKRKVVQRKDLDVCVKRIDGLLFLEGAID